jgi:HK97 family phage major capsid protein
MKQHYQAIMAELKAKSEQVAAIWEAAGDEPLDATKKQEVIDLNKRIEELEHQAKDINEQQAMKDRAGQVRAWMQEPAPNSRLATPTDEPRDGERKERAIRKPGEFVLDDPAFKAWRDANLIGGAFTSARFGSSPRVALPGGLKALITGTSDTSAGAFIQAQQLGLQFTGANQRPLTIRDLITNGTTTSDAIEYPIEGTWTNNAAVVAEATDVTGGTGAKPQSDFTFTTGSTTVKTIAHWVAVTRQALADVGFLRTYIDNFLRYGLDEELEDQILNGSGSGNNFTGITNTSGTTTQAWDTDILTTLRRARTKVRVTGRATPTAYVLHPNDWEDIDLLQDNEGRYYYGGPSVLGTPRLWGLPVVESEAMTEGSAVVADWRRAVLLDREQTQILVSDSHSDFFVRNLIAILAELRAAFFVARPAAFVEIDLTA